MTLGLAARGNNPDHHSDDLFFLLRHSATTPVIPTTQEEACPAGRRESPAIDDWIPFCLRGRLLLRRFLSRASFGMTTGLAGGATTSNPASSNKIPQTSELLNLLNLLNLSGLPPQTFVRPKRFTSRLCVFAVPQTLNIQTLNLKPPRG